MFFLIANQNLSLSACHSRTIAENFCYSPMHLLLCNIFYIFILSDIDECDPDKSLQRCNQICENTPGSYKCSCEKGFEIGRDGYTCEGVKAVCCFNLAVHILIYSNFML